MIENDAFWTAPTMPEIERRAMNKRCAMEQAVRELLDERAAMMALAKGDPFRFGYEPDIWLVTRAVLGLDRIPEIRRKMLAERTGWDEARVWPRWRDGLCSNLGMPHYLSELLMMGANRAGKTDISAKMCHEAGMDANRKVWIGSQQWANSLDTVQERMHRYLPKEWRKDVRSPEEYIKYSSKNGFTGNSFVNRMGTKFKFLFYTQKREDALEGPECHFGWMDEEVPFDFLESLRMRVASVAGRILMSFTPVSGYTPVVADYLEGMRVVRWCHGYMLPRDVGAPAPWHALGLTREEYETLERRIDMRETDPQTIPNSRAEDCVGWGTGPWRDRDENAEPRRVWELVPRLALCRNASRGVIWFHGRDNPYGNPLEVIRKAAANTNARDEIKKRVYGIALKAKGKRFKGFDRKVHVVQGEVGEVQGSGFTVGEVQGSRFTVGEGRVVCYREWPGSDEIPGHGMPEPWAKRSSRKKGMNDGDPDGGQDKFGFSLNRYKFEIARLEGWRDYEDWVERGSPGYEDGGSMIPDDEEIEAWSDANGSREEVAYRIVDGRACRNSKIGREADKTLIDMLNESGMAWEPASGANIGSGEERINGALAWAQGKRPELLFSARCPNHIFAMENYMGEDGQKGACKEPVDCLRYLYQSGLTENAPAGGLNVLVLDPAPERNWFMAWYRIGGKEDGRGKREEGDRTEAGGVNAGRRRESVTRRRGDAEETGGKWGEERPCAGGGTWVCGR